ncbi:aminopeptidase N [bacterium]|nr:aminopeptidase N [bacterium]
MTSTSTPKTIYLKDYTPPAFLIPKIDLFFSLHEETTTVTATMTVQKTRSAANQALRLDGEHIRLLEIKINEQILKTTDYAVDSESLTIFHPPEVAFTLVITTELRPQDNQSFVGLYKTKKIFCTQMEAQGFRRVTYFLDRPDVLSKYTTTIEADAKKYPHLLSNGDRINQESLTNGRHRVTWQDPFPKPCYLFALVAGDLGVVKDTYKTTSGKTIALEIYTDPGNESRCSHAMKSLKESMKWDEDTYGLEYDLNVYMIVAVDDFNMGAMENKGLNIFNSKFVLADEQTATDSEFMGIQTVIAHEYFHNWSGNRVTCRDWFQLSLKEGLTVFRDQEFSADLNSRGVKRIEDVTNLRSRQFPEDASGMAHPIRPASYMAIDNFYTRTVYDKGAEVIRMLQTLLGRETFIKGVKKYFQLFDGQAVTTDDFIKAHEITSGRDLAQFKNWYDQAGTPTVKVTEAFDPVKKELRLQVSQTTIDPVTKKENRPYVIPLKYSAFNSLGLPLNMTLAKGEESTTGVLNIHQQSQEFVFTNVSEKPILSLLREFSAPIRLEYEQSREDLLLLMAKDTDPFCRYEAAQKLYTGSLLQSLGALRENRSLTNDGQLLNAMKQSLLNSKNEDPAFLAKLLTPPSVSYFMQFCQDEKPALVEKVLFFFFQSIQTSLAQELQQTLVVCREQKSKQPKLAADYRALESVALFYQTWGQDPQHLTALEKEYTKAETMTDVMNVLLSATHKPSNALFESFYQKWQHDSLVMNKWFAVQALSWREDCLPRVQNLLNHSAYDKTNPNKIYSLIFSFISLNPLRFHRDDGAGYIFAADQILDIDSRNPQVAARMATCFNEWTKWHPSLKSLAKTQIERVHQHSSLSKNVYEIMDRALKMS